MYSSNSAAEQQIENNDEFHSMFASMFGFEDNCDQLIMRHLYTSICNYVFPGGGSNLLLKNVVSTVDEIAEMSGHSTSTHSDHYSSCVNLEDFYNRYHQSLGCGVCLGNTVMEKTFQLLPEVELVHSMKLVFGHGSTYLSSNQREMIMDAANNITSHTFCSIKCGGGKSCAWELPTLSRHLNRRKTKMSIVMVPYCFLAAHHYQSCVKRFGLVSCNLDIKCLTGKDFEEGQLPNDLKNVDLLPSILFVSLEAMSNIFIFQSW